MQQPDIEIYVKRTPIDAILSWLETCADDMSDVTQQGRSHSLTLTLNSQTIPVTVVEDAAGKAWTSIWLNSPDTPWESDVDCARACHTALNCQIRCNGAFWQEESANMDEWWQIAENGEERLIEWA
ncbi:hypothetical protein [Kistimonas asteriae]|uniref:hypothetical protein n=1 Tax=Kistimonas asteriae TaxID=517724 RepID=UPI001BA8C226|nr:hypothetical protein [Kistimonas asteriae]